MDEEREELVKERKEGAKKEIQTKGENKKDTGRRSRIAEVGRSGDERGI